jgi:hypothetical protein
VFHRPVEHAVNFPLAPAYADESLVDRGGAARPAVVENEANKRFFCLQIGASVIHSGL